MSQSLGYAGYCPGPVEVLDQQLPLIWFQVALGTDTGGSVRGPAAICGTVGLKPTHGRISVRGVFPTRQALIMLDRWTRTVRDCALLLQGLAGYDPDDPFSQIYRSQILLLTWREG